MSSLNPGGARGRGFYYTWDAIRNYLRRSGKSYEDRGSIAQGNRHGGSHEHKREIARRQRQQR